MIFVTGDMHSDWLVRLDSFGKDLTKNDILIICGDFGIWHDTFTERYELDWLDNRNFTIKCGKPNAIANSFKGMIDSESLIETH